MSAAPDEDDDFNDSFDDEDERMNDASFGQTNHDFSDEDITGDVSSSDTKAEFVALSTNDLQKELDSLVKSVAGILNVPPEIASMLLRSERWNKELAISHYLENRHKALQNAGLEMAPATSSSASTAALLSSKASSTTSTDQIDCAICDSVYDKKDSFALSCHHAFCRGCWGDYLEDKIRDGKLAVRTTCPMYKCLLVVPDNVVQLLVKQDVFARYQQAVLRSFVEDSRNMRWCPAARCDRVVKVLGPVHTVQCTCGNKFCFQCSEEPHDPVSCAQLSLWLEKCRNESETAHWIIANTKKCPKCAVRIEKNQGCNHMVCRSCKHEFCWVCLSSWAEHGNHTGGFYRCNKYNPKTKDKVGDKEDAKAELDRYLHYYQRYHNHDQSKHFAEKQQKITEKRMIEMQSRDQTSWIDVQFLKAATDQVFECRRVLKYTYVFGYYLEAGPEKELFEFLQQELEKNTEHLSELSEFPLDKMDRTEVVNYTRVTGQFLKNLLEGVANGLTS